MNGSARQVIAAELRELRRLPGPLEPTKLVTARALTKAFGADDPTTALTRLLDLARENEGDREIEAAMSCMGWGVTSATVLDRMSEYAARNYVDARTVRRWSDEGIRKLTLLVVGTSPWLQPKLRQVLDAQEDQLLIGIDLRIPAELRMGAPQIWVDDNLIELQMPSIERSTGAQRLTSGLETLAALSELPLDIRVSWMGEKLPIYESVVRAWPGLLFTSRLIFTEMRTSVSRWSR